MELKVYISLSGSGSGDEHANIGWCRVKDKLKTLVKGVDISILGHSPKLYVSDIKRVSEGFRNMCECDFVVFANGSDTDDCCLDEKAFADKYNIPNCSEGMLPQFLEQYIAERFNFCSHLKTSAAISRLADLNESQDVIPQSEFVIEECSELIRELTESRCGKSNETDIAAEACDVITSVLVMLRLMHVTNEYICEYIIYKCNRTIERFGKPENFVV